MVPSPKNLASSCFPTLFRGRGHSSSVTYIGRASLSESIFRTSDHLHHDAQLHVVRRSPFFEGEPMPRCHPRTRCPALEIPLSKDGRGYLSIDTRRPNAAPFLESRFGKQDDQPRTDHQDQCVFLLPAIFMNRAKTKVQLSPIHVASLAVHHFPRTGPSLECHP